MAWRLEAVEWEDVTSVSRFTLDHDFESERLFKLSVGFVIRETPEYVVLADDVDSSRRPDSPNNYGTIIPKGCIRSRQVIYSEAPGQPGHGRRACLERLPRVQSRGSRKACLEPLPRVQSRGSRRAESGAAGLVRRFLELNPNIVATARDIGLRLGVEQCEAQRQLTELERCGEARQPLPGLWQAQPQCARKGG